MMEAGTEEFLFVDVQPQTEGNIQVRQIRDAWRLIRNARRFLSEP
jgi:hypothetical protein